jgi:hypothetical protein
MQQLSTKKLRLGVVSWRTLVPGDVVTFDKKGTGEKYQITSVSSAGITVHGVRNHLTDNFSVNGLHGAIIRVVKNAAAE